MCRKTVEESGVEDGSADPIKPVDHKDLPEHLKRVDMPFKLPFYVVYIITVGLITNGLMLYYLFYLLPFGIVSRWTFLHNVFVGNLTGFGLSVGAHRYWSHKSFKANLPLRILLMCLQTATWQGSLFKWCRDHRAHHKYTDTDADPHNSKRGFWFPHMLWLMQPKHPDCEARLKNVDTSDLVADPVVRFQNKYYFQLSLLLVVILPMSFIHYLFPELSLFHAFVLNSSRLGLSQHFTYTINSLAHRYGSRPYDQHIRPSENRLVSALTLGEGWHNYHHTFPWDYRSTDLGFQYNLTTAFISLFAKIGWAWDLKTVSRKLLAARIKRTGDGGHHISKRDTEPEPEPNNDVDQAKTPANPCWGWGDKELPQEDMKLTRIRFPDKARRE